MAVAPETPYNSSLQLLLLLRVIIKKKHFMNISTCMIIYLKCDGKGKSFWDLFPKFQSIRYSDIILILKKIIWKPDVKCYKMKFFS